jgi:hypothetical protein
MLIQKEKKRKKELHHKLTDKPLFFLSVGVCFKVITTTHANWDFKNNKSIAIQ